MFLPAYADWYPAPPFVAPARTNVRVFLPSAYEVLHTGTPGRGELGYGVTSWSWSFDRPVLGVSFVALTAGSVGEAGGSVASSFFRFPSDRKGAGRRLREAFRRVYAEYEKLLGPSGLSGAGAYVNPLARRSRYVGGGLVEVSLRDSSEPERLYPALARELAAAWWSSEAFVWVPGKGAGAVRSAGLFSSWAVLETVLGRDRAAELRLEATRSARAGRALTSLRGWELAFSPKLEERVRHAGAMFLGVLGTVLGNERLFSLLGDLRRARFGKTLRWEDLEAALPEDGGARAVFREWGYAPFATDFFWEERQDGWVLSDRFPRQEVPTVEVLVDRGRKGAETIRLAVGGTVPRTGDVRSLVADPLVRWPDPDRSSNRLPFCVSPTYLARGPESTLLVTDRLLVPSGGTGLTVLRSDGSSTRVELEFEAAGRPRAVDTRRWVVPIRLEKGRAGLLLVDTALSTRRWLGLGHDPAVSQAGIWAAWKRRIVRWEGGRWEKRTVRVASGSVRFPSPTGGGAFFYVVEHGGGLFELRFAEASGIEDRHVAVFADPVVSVFPGSQGEVVYVLTAGEEGKSLRAVSAEGEVRPIVYGADEIRAVARPLPTEGRLALVAGAGRDEEAIYVLEPSREVRRIRLPGRTVLDLVWLDRGRLLALAGVSPKDPRWSVPGSWELLEVDPTSGEATPFGSGTLSCSADLEARVGR
ncbi:MAG: hypothetical protein KatS3mg076_1273 [Candidatus Binatia bacterium]|nr:MAG: hypothetical protein KatS3mg076_1273 [Candidatus Binatia bacterium]